MITKRAPNLSSNIYYAMLALLTLCSLSFN